MQKIIDWLFGDSYVFENSWTHNVLNLDSGIELIILSSATVFVCVLTFSKKIRSKFF